jgi:glycosyltransferase involved in cell wall biosynthesis
MADSAVVTFAVPVYNGAGTLPECLDSLLACPDRVEIIVINDGSTDGTLSIANEYKARHPQILRVVDKANGGHGSGINTAAQIAGGKYFRPIDADDRAVNARAFTEALSKADSDIVLTRFRTFDEASGKSAGFRANGLDFGKQCCMGEFWRRGERNFHACKYHGVTYRTDFYRRCGMELPEGISYGDEIYSTVPFKYAKSILPLDLLLYEYRLGAAGQSVSDINASGRIDDLERVLWAIHSELPYGDASGFFRYKLRQLALAIYAAALLKSEDRQSGIRWAREFDKRTRSRSLPLWLMSRKQYNAAKIMSMLGIDGELLSKIRFNRLYRFVRQNLS